MKQVKYKWTNAVAGKFIPGVGTPTPGTVAIMQNEFFARRMLDAKYIEKVKFKEE